jgi:hypothetical protein
MEQYKDGEVNYICDKCGKGKMISIGTSKKSKCNLISCGYKHTMLKEYPHKVTPCKHKHTSYGTDGETFHMTICLECGIILDYVGK